MGYLGRRIGKAQDQGDSNPAGADGAVGGGILDLFANGYFERQGDIYNAPGIAPSGHTATGGVISDYTDGSTIYRAHIFTSSGSFDVETIGTIDSQVDALVVAGGGGGGGQYHGGGGGAGGMRAVTAIPISTSPGSYTITVGAGGRGGQSDTPASAVQGNHSTFSTVTSQGGGYGGSYSNPNTSPVYEGGRGGSGGGGNGGGSSAGGLGNKGDGTNQPYPTNVPAQGNNGGSGASYGGGGGDFGANHSSGSGTGGSVKGGFLILQMTY